MNIQGIGLGLKTVSQNTNADNIVNSALKTAINTISESAIDGKTDMETPIIDSKTIAKTVEEIQKFCDMCGRKLQFKVNNDTKKIVVKVIDASTDKVVREIPSEEIQKLQARIRETIGLLFDETI